MRNQILLGGTALAALFAAGNPSAQSEDGAPPALLCASSMVVECRTTGGCIEVVAAEVDVPPFMRVDFADSVVSDPRGGDDHRSTIDLIHVVDGQIVLHGTDPGEPGGRDGTSWTATISEASGKMLVSTIGLGAAYMVFGNCLVEE